MNTFRVAARVVAAVVCGSTLLAASAAEPVKVRIGTLVPRGSSHFQSLSKMGEQWKSISGGALSLTIYPDGTMGGEAEMVRRMRAGQLQGGLISAVGLSAIEPGVTALQNLPMAFETLEDVDAVGAKLQPTLEARMGEKGFVVVGWTDAGWVRFFSRRPFETPAELKKQKLFVWAGGTRIIDVLKNRGYQPVPLETSEILPGLQTGLIDVVGMPPWMALALQLDRTAPHMLELNWAPLVGAIVVTQKVWNETSPAQREQLLAAGHAAATKIKEDSRREALESVDAMKKRGLIVHPATPAIIAAWRAEAEALFPTIRGLEIPADLYDQTMKLLEERKASVHVPPK